MNKYEKDLTTSKIDRQNILNNELAVNEIQTQTGIQGIVYDGRIRFTKTMVATYLMLISVRLNVM